MTHTIDLRSLIICTLRVFFCANEYSFGHVCEPFLASVNVSSRSLYVIVRPSVVCNVRAPFSGDWNFRQCFYAMWYLGQNFTEIVPGQPLRWGGLNPRGVAKYSDFRPFEDYISETITAGDNYSRKAIKSSIAYEPYKQWNDFRLVTDC